MRTCNYLLIPPPWKQEYTKSKRSSLEYGWVIPGICHSKTFAPFQMWYYHQFGSCPNLSCIVVRVLHCHTSGLILERCFRENPMTSCLSVISQKVLLAWPWNGTLPLTYPASRTFFDQLSHKLCHTWPIRIPLKSKVSSFHSGVTTRGSTMQLSD